MSTNPIDQNSTPKTTGSLEDLFRHHLGEEAAVPPRPMLWDQIDNSLLVRQNETYRRRLTATRWVAAASLLLATLAGTGWWAGHDATLTRPEVAATRPRREASDTQNPTNSSSATAGLASNNQQSAGSNESLRPNERFGTGEYSGQSGAAVATTAPAAPTGATRTSGLGSRAAQAAGQGMVARHAAPRYTGFGAASKRGGRPADLNAGGRSIVARTATATASSTLTNAALTTDATTHPAYVSSNVPVAKTSGTEELPTTGQATSTTSRELAAGSTAAPAAETGLEAASAAVAAVEPAVVAPEQVSLLAARTATLSLTGPATLPGGLATVPVESLPEVPAISKWRFGASYTAGLFNPNINFSRAGIAPEYDYNTGPAFGSNSPAITEAGAAQYRENLRPGFSQRIALLATRHLAGRWSLSTGAEFGQATAKSATAASLAFVGEQIPDVGQSAVGRMSTTDFRYRMASIPVEMRYSNPVKKGWSLYGRLGGVVSGLLGVRSEVEGDPEATKTYSILSAGTPYRRVLGNLRGGVGAQFRSGAGNWALTVGPTAEIGLVSLNAHPVQSYLAQSRAYSFGLEAGVEFGR